MNHRKDTPGFVPDGRVFLSTDGWRRYTPNGPESDEPVVTRDAIVAGYEKLAKQLAEENQLQAARRDRRDRNRLLRSVDDD